MPFALPHPPRSPRIRPSRTSPHGLVYQKAGTTLHRPVHRVHQMRQKILDGSQEVHRGCRKWFTDASHGPEAAESPEHELRCTDEGCLVITDNNQNGTSSGPSKRKPPASTSSNGSPSNCCCRNGRARPHRMSGDHRGRLLRIRPGQALRVRGRLLGTPLGSCGQVKQVKAFVRLLNEPAALSPMFAFKPQARKSSV